MTAMRVRGSGGSPAAANATIRFGPAGWMYKDWDGIVYPRPRPARFDSLRYIADIFDTVEINSSYYGPPTERTASAWVRRVEQAREFRFTAKLWKRFTHERERAWTTAEVDLVRAGFDVLMNAGRLGAVLLQFPWSYRRTEENREWLGDVVRTFAQYPLVVEVRHTSWLTPDFFRSLEDEGIGFVNIDQPLYRDSIGPSSHVTSHVGYIRVHGRNYKDWFRDKAPVEQRYNYLYTAEELKPWAERTREIAADPATREVYVVTNNHYKGKAVANAAMLESLVTGERVPVPPGVSEAYGEAVAGYTSDLTSSLTARP